MQHQKLNSNLKSDWKFLTIILMIAIAIHILMWIGWPLHAGADADTYIYYYSDFTNPQPVYHHLMCFRTPIAPLFFGTLLNAGGALLTSIILEILSLISILAIYLIAANWSILAGRIAALFLIFYVPFQLQFHQVGTDGLFAFLIIIFCLVFYLALIKKNLFYWFILAIIVVIMTLTRPAGIIFSLSLFSVFFIKLRWKKVLLYIMVFVLCICLPLGGYVLYKGVKYQDYSISRGFNNTTFYRIFRLQENAIKPENGPSTEKLVTYIEQYVLTTELYRKYSVTIEDFLTYKPNGRFTSDCLAIVDIKEGWKSNYKLLSKVAFEAIKASPASFFTVYTKDLININISNVKITDMSYIEEKPLRTATESDLSDEKTIEIPTEGEMVPKPAYFWLATRPNGSLPTTAEEASLKEKAASLIDDYSAPNGNQTIRKLFDYLWEAIKIPVIYCWIFGIVGIVISRDKKRFYILAIILIFLIYIMGTLQGTPPWLKYRLPLDSILLLAGVTGFLETAKKIFIFFSKTSQNNKY